MLQIAVKANQYPATAHEAVQNRHQLRHLGDSTFFRQANTNRAADNHRQQDPRDVAAIRPRMVATSAIAIPAMP
ncbi:hypothetical protein ACNKHR_26680 [Shigella flexneri]